MPSGYKTRKNYYCAVLQEKIEGIPQLWAYEL